MDSVTMGWTVIGVGIALAGLMLATTRSIRADMRVLLERQDKLAERLGRQEQEQTRMNGVLETLPERLDRLEQGQEQLSARLGRQEQEQARMNEVLETLSERLGRLEQGQEQLSARLGRQEQEQARMNGVLETLPERLGRLEQEQARMNGMLETIRAGLSYRVERADTGDRVAEASESYEPQE